MEEKYCYNSGRFPSRRRRRLMTEGDMVLEMNNFKHFDHSRGRRNVLQNSERLWPQGIVYYQFDNSVKYSQKKRLKQAMDFLSSVSCVQFFDREYSIPQYLLITSGGPRCWSHVGYFGLQKHEIALGDKCWNDRTIMHELLHTLGFGHEHNRLDRDNYINVNWDNIREEKRNQFCKNEFGTYKTFDLPYDYRSIMHYYGYGSFAKNLEEPIMFAKSTRVQLGGHYMTEQDICKLNFLYNCNNNNYCPFMYFQ